jgi:hypothetical protein
MATYHLDLGEARTEELADVLNLTFDGDTSDDDIDVAEFVASDKGADQPRAGELIIMRNDRKHPATSAWIDAVEDTSTHQDVVIIAGDPTDPQARRIRLANAWATWTFDRDDDNDDEADAIGIAFDDIVIG